MSEFERERMLIGSENVDKLAEKRVIVFGVGGVGGYICEALARAGVGNIVLVDNDTVSRSNINRQIIALQSTIGRPKVEVMKERILDINPHANVTAHQCFYLPNENTEILDGEFDYIADAIDTMSAKIDIVMKATERGIPIISSMGTGNKLDPTKFEITDLYKTSMCPVCRVMRRELKKHGITKLKVLYSPEEPIKPVYSIDGGRTPASISFVPSCAGLIIAGEIIKDLIEI